MEFPFKLINLRKCYYPVSPKEDIETKNDFFIFIYKDI